ncbi:TIR domain-containing protein [Lutibacter sp.]|uniref:TIR domain-containing protein n=1 Tax=Lutibacter sp. TaxID=1925666 RepID=UPI002734DAB4|nr:TIR domain-containing protein [Lutibacter sp.]MDP3311996.1 TIR domain-containing protein [Lutibacter sp.]
MSSHQIHIFISHSWKYSSVYETLASWIFDEKWTVGQASIDFRNFSVPQDNPIHNAPTNKALTDAIYNQIAKSHVIIIPTGMYANYSNWIQKEIEGSNTYAKPILAVNPRGQERTSGIVVENSHEHVGWSKNSVIDGIWKLYQSNK